MSYHPCIDKKHDKRAHSTNTLRLTQDGIQNMVTIVLLSYKIYPWHMSRLQFFFFGVSLIKDVVSVILS